VDAATRRAKARRLNAVKQELADATRRRTELWHAQGDGCDPSLAAEVDRLSKHLDALWTEARVLTAEVRHGARSDIIARARQADRVERDLRRKERVAPVAVLSR
jgi:ATP-dependent Clp protease ATP-binding subunit ClpA